MSLTDKQFEVLNKTNDDILNLRESHAMLGFQIKAQMLTSQFQLFLSMSSVMLAFQAIIFATELYKTTHFLGASTIFSSVLLFYTVTFVRETIDSQDKSINDSMSSMDQNVTSARQAMRETIQRADFNIWVKHLSSVDNTNSQKKDSKPKQGYQGEFAVFLFTNALLFGLLSVVNLPFDNGVLMYFFILVISFTVSVFDWNTYLTEKVSNFLHKFLS